MLVGQEAVIIMTKPDEASIHKKMMSAGDCISFKYLYGHEIGDEEAFVSCASVATA